MSLEELIEKHHRQYIAFGNIHIHQLLEQSKKTLLDRMESDPEFAKGMNELIESKMQTLGRHATNRTLSDNSPTC